MKKEDMTELIEPELSRVYHFKDCKLELKNVTHILIRESGSHRLIADGKFWIVPNNWIGIQLDIKDWTI